MSFTIFDLCLAAGNSTAMDSEEHSGLLLSSYDFLSVHGLLWGMQMCW